MGGTRDGQFARVAVLVILVLAVGCVVGVASVAGADEEAAGATGEVAVDETVAPDNEGPENDSDDERESEEGEATVMLRPADERVSVGSTTTVDVVVRGAERGISTYEFDIGLNSSAASFVDYRRTSPDPVGGETTPLSKSKIANNNATISLETALMDATHNASEEIVVGEATLKVEEVGAVSLRSGVGDSGQTFVINLPGHEYDITWTESVVRGELPTFADGPPQDADGDGNHEDVRGDGETNIFDVQALFANLDNPALQNSAGKFNFHGSTPDEVTVFDVQQLFIQLG